jgi:hypothetical protein
MLRNYGLHNIELTAGIEAAVNAAFRTEDEPMVEAV